MHWGGRSVPAAIGLDRDGLREANLREADLSNANLVAERLEKTDLTGAVLTRALLDHADLTRSLGLTQAQIDSAHGDIATKLPSNLRVPETWKATSRPMMFPDHPSGGGIGPQ
jgi:hypothetical protein